MQYKNFDGIKIKKNSPVVQRKPVRQIIKVKVDAVVVRRAILSKAERRGRAVKKTRRPVLGQTRDFFWLTSSFVAAAKKFLNRQKLLAFSAAVLLLITFISGAWFALSTSRSNADDSGQVLGAFTATPAGSMQIPGVEAPPQNSGVGNDILFNTPLQDLKNYLAEVSEPDIIATRAKLLSAYLTDKKSPFAPDAEIIAAQPHWELILAIAFAESTLGKNCSDNNCSNIGVKPGAPSWRQYDSIQSWVVDFNRLLDKKYQDWTLEQMCGVYVKPCNPNWLMATQQILEELKDRGIE